ncbi:histidine phosphatase family protein [Stappia indica]|uniref:histidine phosphatase family protein n=1 Tax=Stappia indica TaxID=538381 RepID=UPI00082AB96D|nr:histidine phosphatase family protein [Stappia indica]
MLHLFPFATSRATGPRRRLVLALLALLALPGTAIEAAQASGEAEAWAALSSERGAIAVMRHALAPGTGDPAGVRLDDCSTQRNLDDRGRAQARAIGAAFRERGIAVDQVLTSQWCRARETATLLGLGEVREMPDLNSFFADRRQAESQTQRLAAAIRGLTDGTVAVLVTHQVNITALTSVYPSSGEIIVGRPEGEMFTVIGRIALPAPGGES